MSFGDFGNFNNWSAKDHALNKIVFDEAHKKGGGGNGGGNNNGNVGFVIFIIAIVILVCLLRLSC